MTSQLRRRSRPPFALAFPAALLLAATGQAARDRPGAPPARRPPAAPVAPSEVMLAKSPMPPSSQAPHGAAVLSPPSSRAVAPATSGPAASRRAGRPLPTEHWLDHDAERRSNSGREQYLEQIHRAAPGTDWRAIEAKNGEALMRLRAALRLRKDFTLDAWTERGSVNQAGRIHAVAVGLDGNTLYAGSSLGGTWRGAIDGTGWTPIGDNLYGGTQQVAARLTTSGEAVLALTDGGRLRYTIDGGATWVVPAGLPGGVNGGIRLLSDPADPSRAFVLLAVGERRIYRTDDGGINWTLQRALGSFPADMWMDRVVGGKLWVMVGSEVWTDDLAGTWQREGTAVGFFPRDVRIAGSEAGAPTLYAVMQRSDWGWELHRSDDAGRTWAYQRDIGDFYGTLGASITDPLLVTTGGVEVFRSTDGGANGSVVNTWDEYYGNPDGKLHADVWGLQAMLVGGNETWFVSTDGGTYRSDDKLATVHNLSLDALRVSQYYSTLTSKRNPWRIQAGAQDQGYQRSETRGGPVAAFDQLISGDYAHLTSGDRTHDWVYSVYPGFVLVSEGEATPVLSFLDFPGGANLQWLPFVLADPTRMMTFYLCADHLWRYDGFSGGVWNVTQHSPQSFVGGGGGVLTALSISPADTARWIAINDAGVAWTSTNAGATWQQSPDRGPSSHYFSGTALIHSATDPQLAYAGGAGYSGPAVYRTTDGGVRWTPVGNGLPRTMVFGLTWEAPDSAVVYAATEAGPYRLDPATDNWEYIGGTVAPLTTYWSVESVPEIGVIRFGTYGRGIWDWQARLVPEAGHCTDGVDNDDDGVADCADADCDASDVDSDGATDCTDCAPDDPGAIAPPGEVMGLRVNKPTIGSSDVRVSWPGDVQRAAGTNTVHDVAAGDLMLLRLSGWPALGDCLADNLPGLSADDTRPDIVAEWYLVRAQGTCGDGSWGPSVSLFPGCP